MKKYKLLIWRDQSGICFKLGYEYGYGCWETIFPRYRPWYFILPFFDKPMKILILILAMSLPLLMMSQDYSVIDMYIEGTVIHNEDTMTFKRATTSNEIENDIIWMQYQMDEWKQMRELMMSPEPDSYSDSIFMGYESISTGYGNVSGLGTDQLYDLGEASSYYEYHIGSESIIIHYRGREISGERVIAFFKTLFLMLALNMLLTLIVLFKRK